MSVRSAEASDLGALVAICASTDSRWGAQRLQQQLERDDSLLLVGEVSGEPVGWLTARKTADIWELWFVVVQPEGRRRGVGRELVASLLARAENEGSTVDAEVSDRNQSALALYLSEGFEEVGRRPGYYPDGSDALLLRLKPSGVSDPS